MSTCARCNIPKRDDAFRHKTSGVMAGYRFPKCIQCEGDQADARAADEVRDRGYVVTQPDATKAAREEADKTERARLRGDAP